MADIEVTTFRAIVDDALGAPMLTEPQYECRILCSTLKNVESVVGRMMDGEGAGRSYEWVVGNEAAWEDEDDWLRLR